MNVWDGKAQRRSSNADPSNGDRDLRDPAVPRHGRAGPDPRVDRGADAEERRW